MNQKLTCAVLLVSSVFGFISDQAVDAVCVICNSADDNNCLHAPASMLPFPCVFDDTCFTRIESGHVVRGCAETLPADVRANCTGEINDCRMCIQISAIPNIPCNNEIFPAQRLLCHQCQGHINTSCGQVPNTNPILCPLFSRNDRCFIRRDGEIIIRGCESSNICSDGRCFFCSGNGCNIRNGADPEIPDASSA